MRIALLVDADSVNQSETEEILAGTACYGEIVVRKAFGRMTSLATREAWLTSNAFAACPALAPPGKGTADIMIGMEAVRLTERRAVDAIALASRDGDMIAIAKFIADYGIATIGVGRKDAAEEERGIYSYFVRFLGAGTANPPAGSAPAPADKNAVKAIRIIDKAIEPKGEELMTTIGTHLSKGLGKDYKELLGVKTLTKFLEQYEDRFGIQQRPGKASATPKKVVVRTPGSG